MFNNMKNTLEYSLQNGSFIQECIDICFSLCI